MAAASAFLPLPGQWNHFRSKMASCGHRIALHFDKVVSGGITLGREVSV